MNRIKKKTAVICVCMIAMCSAAFAAGVLAAGEFNDFEKFESVNKSFMQRHANARVLMRLPIFRQSRAERSGVSCVQSVLRYAKYDFDIREDKLADALGVSGNEDAKWYKMSEYLNSVRLDDNDKQYFKATKRNNMLIDDLIEQIDKGNPVILAIQAWNTDENGEYSMDLDYSQKWEYGHWVVAVGHNKDSIFFMDPSTAGNYTYIPKDKLVSRWHDYFYDNGQRCDELQLGIIVELCGSEEPDGELYKDAFYGLM